jgi:hypothetical protein
VTFNSWEGQPIDKISESTDMPAKHNEKSSAAGKEKDGRFPPGPTDTDRRVQHRSEH